MIDNERIKANADKGYILVASFDGWEIYKKQNEVGGWTYYSDQIGTEGAYPIWDTAVRSIEELQAIMNDIRGKLTPISIAPFEPPLLECPNCHKLQKHTYPMTGKLYCECGALLDEIYE